MMNAVTVIQTFFFNDNCKISVTINGYYLTRNLFLLLQYEYSRKSFHILSPQEWWMQFAIKF